MKKLLKMYVVTILKIRWWWFHVSPSYVKFTISADSSEEYFQNVVTGEIVCNYTYIDDGK
jgi:hypothetical protein